jgi:hypothetical protein
MYLSRSFSKRERGTSLGDCPRRSLSGRLHASPQPVSSSRRSPIGLGFQVALPSFSAQALITAEFALSVPGMMAQPPFSIIERRSQDGALLNATSFAAASVCCWNFSTQSGASAATTAVSARWVAIFSAVLPSVHPSCENPTTVNAKAPATAPHTAGFTPEGSSFRHLGFSHLRSECLHLVSRFVRPEQE